jgi:hypothetical protein
MTIRKLNHTRETVRIRLRGLAFMRWVVRSRSRRMARNALRLEAQDFMRQFRRFLSTHRASSLTLCQIDRPVSRAFQWPSAPPIALEDWMRFEWDENKNRENRKSTASLLGLQHLPNDAGLGVGEDESRWQDGAGDPAAPKLNLLGCRQTAALLP